MEVRDKHTRVEVRMETLFEVLVLSDRRMPPVSEVLEWFREKYGSQYEDYEIDSVDIHQDGWVLTVVALNRQYETTGVKALDIDTAGDTTHVTIRYDGPHAHDCTPKDPEMTTDVLSHVVTDGSGEVDKG